MGISPNNTVIRPLMELIVAVLVLLGVCVSKGSAQLRENFYAESCPNVEHIVRGVAVQKFRQNFASVTGTVRLFHHDCFVEGCDASVTVQSTKSNKAERDHPDSLTIAGDGFDTVVKAKQAVEEQCPGKVSCADILAIANRDMIEMAGGPSYSVELGRRDGLISKSSRVEGNLPKIGFNLDQLTSLFKSKGLSQNDMIALSGVHTIGFSHCNQFADRIYNYSQSNPIDPTLNETYARELMEMCPKNVNPTFMVALDPTTPRHFDNEFYKNLQLQKGIFTSDQVLYDDSRSRNTVNSFADNNKAFNNAFVQAMTKMGRIGVKTGVDGEIRRDCTRFNYS
eukprot:Gb_00476 [translate_table: standard]